jgi:serine/threonine protein kinase
MTIEQDWSGRGQHAFFQKSEHKIVNEILEVHDTLGITNTAKVESVKCRRILLARKTMLCKKTLDKEEAIKEVAHLSALEHPHILRVIGTYVMGNQLSILLYPVAEWNLKQFMESMRGELLFASGRFFSCDRFFGCLCNATCYIHSKLTKHMDIKPENILVKRNLDAPPGQFRSGNLHKVFIADFGIARSYNRQEDIMTDGPTGFTPEYAAPEVIKYELRGLPADIFSLGCVFLEMLTSMNITYDVYRHLESRSTPRWRSRWSDLRQVLATNIQGDDSYQANIHELQDFSKSLQEYPAIASIIHRMIRHNPEERPTAAELRIEVPGDYCCRGGPCQLEAFQEEEEEEEAPDSDMHIDFFSMRNAV